MDQRLSPLYVSVHSTNPEIRRRLIRPRADRDVLKLLDFLLDHGIIIHTQIVLCPGYNDGEDLEGTIRDLSARWPGIRSLAIVPLGMTDHREGLVALRPFAREDAEAVRLRVAALQKAFRKQWGVGFVYLADEIYRLLGMETPPNPYYDDFPQLENGIGMTRHFLTRLGRKKKLFSHAVRKGERRFTLVTGELFEPILRGAIEATLARTREDVQVGIIGCRNEFFGRSVTVAGLLTGRDILRGLSGREIGDRVFIPPATLNDDGLFLDDMTLDRLAGALGVPVEAGLFRT